MINVKCNYVATPSLTKDVRAFFVCSRMCIYGVSTAPGVLLTLRSLYCGYRRASPDVLYTCGALYYCLCDNLYKAKILTDNGVEQRRPLYDVICKIYVASRTVLVLYCYWYCILLAEYFRVIALFVTLKT